jgi:hypothetical protein
MFKNAINLPFRLQMTSRKWSWPRSQTFLWNNGRISRTITNSVHILPSTTSDRSSSGWHFFVQSATGGFIIVIVINHNGPVMLCLNFVCFPLLVFISQRVDFTGIMSFVTFALTRLRGTHNINYSLRRWPLCSLGSFCGYLWKNGALSVKSVVGASFTMLQIGFTQSGSMLFS